MKSRKRTYRETFELPVKFSEKDAAKDLSAYTKSGKKYPPSSIITKAILETKNPNTNEVFMEDILTYLDSKGYWTGKSVERDIQYLIDEELNSKL